MKITVRKTLELIEAYSVELSSDDRNMAQIYMWAHTALNPKCRKHHSDWTKDLMKRLEKMK